MTHSTSLIGKGLLALLRSRHSEQVRRGPYSANVVVGEEYLIHYLPSWTTYLARCPARYPFHARLLATFGCSLVSVWSGAVGSSPVAPLHTGVAAVKGFANGINLEGEPGSLQKPITARFCSQGVTLTSTEHPNQSRAALMAVEVAVLGEYLLMWKV
jgi:hypothetical protein